MSQEVFYPEDHAEMVENWVAQCSENDSCIECGESTSNHLYCDACVAHHEDADRLADSE